MPNERAVSRVAELDRLQMEMLDEDQRQLAELIGIDNYRKMVEVYGGQVVYIPKPDSYLRLSRDEQIRAKFNGQNYRQLASEYGLTEMWIRCIVADVAKEMRKRPVDGQITLFDETAS